MDRIRSPTVNSISDYNHNTHIDTHIDTHTDTQWHTELSLPKHHRIGNFFQLFASLTTLIRMVLFNKQSTSMHLLTLNLTDDSFSFANLKKWKTTFVSTNQRKIVWQLSMLDFQYQNKFVCKLQQQNTSLLELFFDFYDIWVYSLIIL